MAMALKSCFPHTDAEIVRKNVNDFTIVLPADFQLESGDVLNTKHLKIRLQGNQDGPKIICLGGISASRIVADDDAGEKGWWRDFVGYDAAIDLNKYCVIGFDFLPGNETNAITITTYDQARALAYALSSLNIAHVKSFIGCSYGGMVALAFASLYPEKVQQLCVISAAHKAHPAAIAQRGVQRRILALAQSCGKPEEGVALARQLAMISYRSAEEFDQRFSGKAGPKNGDSYDVCEYLIARGEQCAMSLHCYMALSDSIDRHYVDPATIKVPTVLIASDTDNLVFPDDMKRLQAEINAHCVYKEIHSIYGHDAFLKEAKAIGPILTQHVEQSCA